MGGYAEDHSPHTYKVFKYTPGTSGEILITRNVRWEHWESPFKTQSSPIFTKAQRLSKDQQEQVEKAIDKFIIDNKMCQKEYWTIDNDLRGDDGSKDKGANGSSGHNLEKSQGIKGRPGRKPRLKMIWKKKMKMDS
jgi:hypothetical protein